MSAITSTTGEPVVCPDCGNDARFFLVVAMKVEITEGAIKAVQEIAWNDDSEITCAECGISDTIASFLEMQAVKRLHL